MRGLLKNLLLLSVVALMASGCAGMKKKGGGGGGGGNPPDNDGGPRGGNAQAKRDQDEIQRLVDKNDEVERALREDLNNRNNTFAGIAGQVVNPNQFNVPGQQPLPGFDPNVVSGNPFETGAQAGGGAPLDPNARPQVFEAGADPLVAVGNPTANLRSNATRQPATTQPATRGLASH